MARLLHPLVVDLEITPAAYELRTGTTQPTRTPSADDVRWDLARTAIEWSTDGSEFHLARASLPSSGGKVITDAAFDVVSNGPRTWRTPPIVGTAIREWSGIDLFFDEPVAETTVRFRLWDGTDARYWNGATWAIATDPAAHWNTAAQVRTNISTFPRGGRTLAVVARLSSTTEDETPAFYGARVAYGVTWQDGLDDALRRTVLRSLRSEIRCRAELRKVADADLDEIVLPPDGEWDGYQVTDVLAAYDLTADPLEEDELAGTWTSDGDGGGTFEFADTFPEGHQLALEFEYAPDVVVSRHAEAEQIDRMPAVWLSPGSVSTAFNAVDDRLVRNHDQSPPVALAVGGMSLLEVPVEVRVISSLQADAARIALALRAWLGRLGYRRLLSPETGLPCTVRENEAPTMTTATLADGVAEQRAGWILAFSEAQDLTLRSETLVREDGITADTEEQ